MHIRVYCTFICVLFACVCVYKIALRGLMLCRQIKSTTLKSFKIGPVTINYFCNMIYFVYLRTICDYLKDIYDN